MLNDYSFDLSASAKGVNLPEGSWRLSGQRSDQALNQFNLNGQTLDGNIRASGKASWKPEVNWQVTLNSDSLNPAAHWPELPGNLNAELNSTGKLTPDGLELSANIARLSGRFRGQKVGGKGQIKMQGKTLDIRSFNLGVGKTQKHCNLRLRAVNFRPLIQI